MKADRERIVVASGGPVCVVTARDPEAARVDAMLARLKPFAAHTAFCGVDDYYGMGCDCGYRAHVVRHLVALEELLRFLRL